MRGNQSSRQLFQTPKHRGRDRGKSPTCHFCSQDNAPRRKTVMILILYTMLDAEAFASSRIGFLYRGRWIPSSPPSILLMNSASALAPFLRGSGHQLSFCRLRQRCAQPNQSQHKVMSASLETAWLLAHARSPGQPQRFHHRVSSDHPTKRFAAETNLDTLSSEAFQRCPSWFTVCC